MSTELSRQQAREATRRWRELHPDYAKEYYRKNAAWIAEKTRQAKKAHPEVFRERARKHWNKPSGRARFMLRSARQRSQVVTITREWIQERLNRGTCEVTGLPFVYDSSGQNLKNPWSPSLDRKVPSLGYTPENTQVVVWIYNIAKGSWKHEDVLKLASVLK